MAAEPGHPAPTTWPPPLSPTHLVVAIVQRQDLASLLAALLARGYRVTILASAGGFLGRASATLLLAVADWQVRVVKRLLAEHCHEREEWRPVAPAFAEGYALPLAVTVGGAVVFVLRLARYERLTTP